MSLSGQITSDEVVAAYQMLLGREPESVDAINCHKGLPSFRQLVENIVGSVEFGRRTTQSPFWFFNSMIDAQEISNRHARRDLKPTPGYQTNFLGVLVNPKYFPEGLKNTDGTIEPIPIPANWHADIAEWAAVLRAVDLAKVKFRMLELGCGWGCWMNNAGVAAQNSGRTVEVIGVEGDATHVEFAFEACKDNGLVGEQVRVVHGIAAASDGIALFPRRNTGGSNYGFEPILGASTSERDAAVQSGDFDALEMVSIDRVIGDKANLDLLHVDIQGGEAELLSSCIDILNRKVSYIVVGTHSREIEGRIFETMRRAGWLLEIERPAILALHPSGPSVIVDGVQVWRNPSSG